MHKHNVAQKYIYYHQYGQLGVNDNKWKILLVFKITIFLFQPRDVSFRSLGMGSTSTWDSALRWRLLIIPSAKRGNVLKTLEVTLSWKIPSMARSVGDAWLSIGSIKMYFRTKRVSQYNWSQINSIFVYICRLLWNLLWHLRISLWKYCWRFSNAHNVPQRFWARKMPI